MGALANLHGQIMPLEEVRISPLDRGFLFGDSVYEVLRIYSGKAWLEQDHFERLARSLNELRIVGVDVDRLRSRMVETLRAGSFQEATVYIQVTRGSAYPRRHAFPPVATPLELLWCEALVDPYVEKRCNGVAVITHPDLRWHRCDIKSTNLLGNVFAIEAAMAANASEALLYHQDGTFTEASHSSFFAVRKGHLITTPKTDNILPGCTRGFVIQLATKLGIPLEEGTLRRNELPAIDELFLTGTTCEILPIVTVDGKPVASGKPGALTRKLQDAYAEALVQFRS